MFSGRARLLAGFALRWRFVQVPWQRRAYCAMALPRQCCVVAAPALGMETMPRPSLGLSSLLGLELPSLAAQI